MHKVIATEAGEKPVHQGRFTQDGLYLASYLQHVVTWVYRTWGKKAVSTASLLFPIFRELDLEALKFSLYFSLDTVYAYADCSYF